MGREGCILPAGGTNGPIADSISTIPLHGRIMLLDFFRQIHDAPSA